MINKNLNIILLLVLAFVGFCAIQESKTNQNQLKTQFKHGEKLTYTMIYGPIHGGNAVLELHLVKYNNMQVYHAKATAKSIGITDKIFNIEDIYESYFDTKSCLPYKSIRNITEGNYKYYNEVFFTQKDCTLYSQRSGNYKVPPNILDVVSSFYYLRKMDLESLKKGDVIELITFFGDEIFPFPLRYRGKEVVKIKLGKFSCYRFDPVVEVGRVFESEDDMTVWISADQNKIPIRVRFDMVVGAVYCDLTKYQNISASLNAIK